VGSLGETRKVLEQYRPGTLRLLLIALGLATAAAYVAYTQAPHTVEFFGTRAMIFSAPFCLLGLLRFWWLVTRPPRGDSPTDEMLRDWPFMLNLAVWGVVVLAIVYRG
jgi:hypothetical protein